MAIDCRLELVDIDLDDNGNLPSDSPSKNFTLGNSSDLSNDM